MKNMKPAAFGRLCVETAPVRFGTASNPQPPSGGCVLKQYVLLFNFGVLLPAAFGRLCVETVHYRRACLFSLSSRLRAAVC